ncbi:MAG: helix-turn-helix domain-containing protein [Thermoleophilia bacterium]|nr:helix-turn-helix domain-containing protein [Thermoleophilia bacterium]
MDLPVANNPELIQPTRARIFTLLAELRRPAGTEELARQLGLHPNGVRIHLERMQSAGLLERRRERQARGRPRDSWSISTNALPGGDPPTAYSDLGRWLVRAITATDISEADVEEAGMRIGRDMAPVDGDGQAEQQLFDVLSALGFQPEREVNGLHELTYCLGNCPYRDVVRERQSLVCGLHKGMIRGLVEALDDQSELTGFLARDPDVAGCLIELEGPMATAAAGGTSASGEGDAGELQA